MRSREDNIEAIYTNLRRQLKEGSLLMIEIGFIVGIYSIRKILHLEYLSDVRYREVLSHEGI